MQNLFLNGAIIGISIAAPVGPIGILCIKRSLSEGRRAGFVSGLGAASADAVYGICAGAGLTIITNFLLSYQKYLGLAGGIFLLYLAFSTLTSAPKQPQGAEPPSSGSAYLSTFFLTLTNPMTILSFIAIFAGLGVGASQNSFWGALTLVLGVFVGSAIWWLFLSSFASLFKNKLEGNGLIWINRASGIIIGAFGLLAIARQL